LDPCSDWGRDSKYCQKSWIDHDAELAVVVFDMIAEIDDEIALAVADDA
jgi:hypothetical protein